MPAGKPLIFLKTNGWAWAMALVIGLLTVAPNLWFILSLGNRYQGIPMMKTDAELHYMARMREAYDGGFWGNPYIRSLRDLPTSFPSASEYILAVPGRLFGLRVTDLQMAHSFLLPFLTFLLAYYFCLWLTGRRLFAIAAAAACMLGPWFFSPSAYWNAFFWKGDYSSFLPYARPINPQFSGLLFFAYLNVLVRALKARRVRWFVWLALLFGLAIYSYLYLWTFLLVLTIVCGLASWLKHERRVALGLLSSVLAGGLAGLPVLFEMWHFMHHELYAVTASISDLGLTGSHRPTFGLLALMCTLLLSVIWFLKGKELALAKDEKFTFLLALLVTAWIVMNQQVITGVSLQAGHYHWYYNVPVYIMILYWAVSLTSGRRFRRIGTAIVILSIAAVSLVSVRLQSASYGYWFRQVEAQQGMAGMLHWLDSQPRGTVIADPAISDLVPIYTSHDVYWASQAANYLVTQDHIDDVLIAYAWLYGCSADDGCPTGIMDTLFGRSGTALMERLQGRFPSDLQQAAVKRIGEGADYLALDRELHPTSLTDDIAGWPLVYQDARYIIFKIDRPSGLTGQAMSAAFRNLQE